MQRYIYHLFIFGGGGLVATTEGTVAQRLPCPSLSPRVCSNFFPLNWRCHPSISFSFTPSTCALNLSQHQGLFQWVSSSHQVAKYWKFSFSISSSNEYSGLISLGLTGLILQSNGLSRVFSSTSVQKIQFFGTQPSLWSNTQHPYMTTRKIITLNIWTFVSKVISLLFNTLSRFVMAFLSRSRFPK